MPCPQSYHFEPLFLFLNAPSIDRTFGNLTQICHGMLLGNTLEVVCFFFFFFKLGECSLLTCISLMSKQRGGALFVSFLFRPSRSSSNKFSALPSASFSSFHMMYPTLPPKSSPAASGPWSTPLCPVLRALQSLPPRPAAPPPRSTPVRAGCQCSSACPCLGHPVPYSLLLLDSPLTREASPV